MKRLHLHDNANHRIFIKYEDYTLNCHYQWLELLNHWTNAAVVAYFSPPHQTPFWTAAYAGFVIRLVPQIASRVPKTSLTDLNLARFLHHQT